MQISAGDLGFVSDGSSFYKVSETHAESSEFQLDAQRVENLTRILKYLESQKFTIEKD